MAVATLVGVGALMMPLPETFAPVVEEAKAPAKKARQQSVQRKAQAPGKAAPKAPVPAPIKKMPKMDSTKARLGAAKK